MRRTSKACQAMKLFIKMGMAAAFHAVVAAFPSQKHITLKNSICRGKSAHLYNPQILQNIPVLEFKTKVNCCCSGALPRRKYKQEPVLFSVKLHTEGRLYTIQYQIPLYSWYTGYHHNYSIIIIIIYNYFYL